MPEGRRSRGTGRNRELTNAQRKTICLHKDATSITNRELSQWATEQFSFRVSEMTISRTLKRRDKWVSENTTPEGKRARKLVCPEVEDATYAWFLAVQDKGGPLTDALICEAARRFYATLYHNDSTEKKQLVFSHGWLGRFKKRHGIKGHMNHGEQQHVVVGTSAKEGNHQIDAVNLIISDYDPRDVFYMEETGLLFALEPFKILATKRISATRMPNEKITVGFTANLDGSVKLPPLVINKYMRRQAFISRSILNPLNLGILWHADQFARMTSQIFEKYLLDFEKRMLLAGKSRALLLVNNEYSEFLANVEKNVKITVVKFVPSSSRESGIISFVKACYRKHLLQYHIDCILSAKDSNVDIYHAVVCLEKSWRAHVTPAAISNGWRHMYLPREQQVFGNPNGSMEAGGCPPRHSFELNDQLAEISELLEQLKGYSTSPGTLPDMSAQEYVHFEEQNGLASSYVPREDEVCREAFQTVEFEEEGVDPDVPVGGVVPSVTYSSVQESLQTIGTYLLQQREDATDMLQNLRALEGNLASHHARVGRQRDIARLFIVDS